MFNQHKDNLGYFVEKDHKHEFTYRLTTNAWALKHKFQYECDVGFIGEVRFCNIKKTRVIVCTDEDGEGKPVVETWIITKNIVFT